MGMEDRLIEADAIVGGDRAAANERKLHDALRRHAAALPVPSFGASALFQSFFLGGFECSSHGTRHRGRLDLISATCHDRHTQADYRELASQGIRTVRDGYGGTSLKGHPASTSGRAFYRCCALHEEPARR